jgi:hypothetical protein
MASNDLVRTPPPIRAEVLNARIFAADPPTVVGSGRRLMIGEDGTTQDAEPAREPKEQALIDLGVLDWDDPALVLPPWAVGLTPEERRLVDAVGNDQREPYAEQLRSWRRDREAKEAHSENLVGLAPAHLRQAAVQDLPGAIPKPEPRQRRPRREITEVWADTSSEPKPTGIDPSPQFVALTPDEVQRVQPAKTVVRHRDHSKGYFTRVVGLTKRNGRQRTG